MYVCMYVYTYVYMVSSCQHRHCPQNLDINMLIEADRYCSLHDGEHSSALRKNSDTIAIRATSNNVYLYITRFLEPEHSGKQAPPKWGPGSSWGHLGVQGFFWSFSGNRTFWHFFDFRKWSWNELPVVKNGFKPQFCIIDRPSYNWIRYCLNRQMKN